MTKHSADAVATGGLFFVEGCRVTVAPMPGQATGVVAWMKF